MDEGHQRNQKSNGIGESENQTEKIDPNSKTNRGNQRNQTGYLETNAKQKNQRIRRIRESEESDEIFQNKCKAEKLEESTNQQNQGITRIRQDMYIQFFWITNWISKQFQAQCQFQSS